MNIIIIIFRSFAKLNKLTYADYIFIYSVFVKYFGVIVVDGHLNNTFDNPWGQNVYYLAVLVVCRDLRKMMYSSSILPMTNFYLYYFCQ